MNFGLEWLLIVYIIVNTIFILGSELVIFPRIDISNNQVQIFQLIYD